MLSRLSITALAPLLVGIPVLVVGVWLSVMWNRQSLDAVTQLADQNIEQIHDMAATKIADELAIPVRVCQVNAHLVRSGVLDPADLSTWRPTFNRQARAFDMLSSIAWGSVDGRSAWISRYADGSYFWAIKGDGAAAEMAEWRIDAEGKVSGAASNFDFDLFSRPWFTAPRAAKGPAWCKPYVWVGGEDSAGSTLGISYGIPLYGDGGDLLGVVDADFSLNDLSRFLQSIQYGKTGVAVLTTREGKLLAASNDTPIIKSDDQLLSAAQSPDPLIVAAAAFLGEAESVGAAHAEIDVDGEIHYLRASPVGRQVGLDWMLVTIIPEKDFVAQIEAEFHRSWIASLIGVALAVAVGVAASRWLVAPLVTLVSAVRRIGQGDLETRVQIHHAPEYTKLAEEINQMTEALQDRMRMRASLSLAMEVQQNLLPSAEPTIRRLDIAGHSTYCDETGGDYYDFLDVSDADEDTAVIALGDVMGHGVAAAMLMATARGILRSRCSVPGSLADFLDHVNEMLVPDTGGHRFMTMLLLTVSGMRDTLRWASAGHGPPIIYDANTDTFPELDGGGLPLGLVAGEVYEEYVQPNVRPGYLILAATDGLWETMGEDDVEFGMDRVHELLRENANRPAAEISEAIRDTLAQYRGPNGQDDDLTFVIAKVL
jgi:serine phosphatase RsbU (regulator of sigma subunit)